MKTKKTRGFVLVLVIVALSLTAVLMAVLTTGANTMLFHADRAHCQAMERNLAASGLVWAQHRIADPHAAPSGQPVQLDAVALTAGTATLTVSFRDLEGATGRLIRIETACTKGRQALNRTHIHPIPATQ